MNVIEKITPILKEKLQPHADRVAGNNAIEHDYLPAVLLTCIEGNSQSVDAVKGLVNSNNENIKGIKTLIDSNNENIKIIKNLIDSNNQLIKQSDNNKTLIEDLNRDVAFTYKKIDSINSRLKVLQTLLIVIIISLALTLFYFFK